MSAVPPETLHAGNRLLGSLPGGILAALAPSFVRVPLQPMQVVHRAGAPIEAVFFIEQGLISILVELADGTEVEVALVGREGMLGSALVIGAESSFANAAVHVPGSALRIERRAFLDALAAFDPLRDLVLRFAAALDSQFMQTAACNARHALEQRLARWLLSADERLDGPAVPVTQDALARMLGVHRPSVTVAARLIQAAGLIRYTPGQIVVIDRPGLEAASCECFAAVRKRYDFLLSITRTRLYVT